MFKLKPILIFLCLILHLIIPISEAKEKPGSEVLIQKIEGTEVRGELIAVKANALLVLDAKTGTDVTTDVKGIYSIKVMKKSHPWKGAGIGLLAGLASGWVCGYSFPGQTEQDAYYPKAYAIMFSAPGALAGLITSQIIAMDKTYLIKGRSPEAISAILDNLRKKARVKDFN